MNQLNKYKSDYFSVLNFFCVLFLASAFAASNAPAQEAVQGMETINLPIEAAVSPTVAAPGMRVKITGKTEFDSKRFDVKAVITPPSGAPVTLSTKIDETGKFEISFDKTNALGKYAVKLIAPDGKGTAMITFSVSAPAVVFARPADAVAKSLNTANQAAIFAADLVAKLPPSDKQDEMLAKAAKIKAHLAQAQAVGAKLHQAFDKLAEIMARNPETSPAFEQLNAEFDGLAAEIDRNNTHLQQELAGSKQAGSLCEQLDIANEIFSAISFAFDINEKAVGTLKNFLNDKGTPRTIEKAMSASGKEFTDGQKFAITEVLKTSAGFLLGGAPSPVGWFGVGIGLLNDFAQFQAGQIFGQYCERFDGPVDATIFIRFMDGNDFFWSYKVTLKGKMAMRYAKQPPGGGGAVAVKGQIEGNATKIEFDENFIVMNPKLKRNLIFRRTVAPPTVPYNEDIGTFARMATPGYFRIPFEGEMIGDNVKIKWLPASNDFSKTYKGKGLYIFVAPPIFVPQLTKIDLPFENAEFIVTRATSATPSFEVKTQAGGKSRVIERAFTRDAAPSNEIKAEFRMSVKMCNPSCLNAEVFQQ